MRPNNVAPMRRVQQEAKQERAISVFMVANDHATSVTGVEKPRVARRGTAREGLRTAEEVVMKAMILLAYGGPIQAIVHA